MFSNVNIIKVAFYPPKLINRFNAIPDKLPTRFFIKYMMIPNRKRKTLYRGGISDEKLTLSNIGVYYEESINYGSVVLE